MCEWKDIVSEDKKGRKTTIPASTVQAVCEIILQAAHKKRLISYSEVMDELKKLGCKKINRSTIGDILGEVSYLVAESTNPSIYPSAI